MTEMGTRLLVALRDQGWLVTFGVQRMLVVSPVNGRTYGVPMAFLEYVADDRLLRIVILRLAAEGGLEWPWPPNYDESIHGEQPVGDW